MFDPNDVVPIKAGITKFDIDGDGLEDFVVKSLRNNITAHRPAIYTFYRTCNKNEETDVCGKYVYETICFIYDQKNSEIFPSFWTRVGADAILEDIRVIKDKKIIGI
jgi:hypothetical protein